MSETGNRQFPRLASRAAAWAVHLLTAAGGACGLLAIREAAHGRFPSALHWMMIAVAIDAVDGPLARRLKVDRRLPQIDGALLDNIVDYLNYAVVPAFLILEARLLPAGWEVLATALICMASAFQFSHVEAKTAEHYFRGFPSYWNVLALYLLALRPAPWLSLAIVIVLGLLSFVPLRCVYPTRTTTLRRLTLGLTVVWGAVIVAIVIRLPDAPRGWVYGSLAYPAYYLVLSLALSRRSARDAHRRRASARDQFVSR